MAIRLEKVMHEVISTSQTTFLKGRLLPVSFVTTTELVAQGGSKIAVEEVGVKEDFKKAYDKVSWDFLFKIMECGDLARSGVDE